ncbi:DUF4407 domain-containing protein [Cytophagales bacterium LB-30]|uniref:DUF4407 domain-containing protein n=1 Tax=Shiella aurantiaca TaxID=3058365 RepID=A0ABT8F172_9BACT|nr:DUF4407 domain-containing protein [Shiella aurantiaca]MDN4163989.1 DUF4407 domain-containing protein [Shiella aurantiaca]
MKRLQHFFWLCSGADISLLQQTPTEHSKFTGIGATIFFTGIFAAISGAFALYTIFDSLVSAIGFGLLWGLMIFNLDRYIVSGMRKEGKPAKEWLMATPRIVLALLISLVIAKPLELKIFEKEIAPELLIMEQQAYQRQENQLNTRFLPTQDSLKQEIATLQSTVERQKAHRDALLLIAQQEADGTGGSQKRNLGPIYKVKKAQADQADAELQALQVNSNQQIAALQALIQQNEQVRQQESLALEKQKRNGIAARMEALDRIAADSSAIYWAHIFIILLFIAIETAPIFVKLVANQGPYDRLLGLSEHAFIVQEIETLAQTHSDAKQNAQGLTAYEKEFLSNSLDKELH